MNVETKLAQIGNRRDEKTGAINFPIYHSAAYQHPELGESTGYDYTRTANPTRTVLEDAIATLEKGDRGFALSSGMAAIQVIFSLFSAGDHIVASLDLYGGTYRLFEQVLRRFSLQFSYVDARDMDSVEAAIGPSTKAIFIESPTNPMMHEADIHQIARLAKNKGLITIVDNTFLTPYFQNPIPLGADIVVHSGTKYLGGHNDVLAGLIVSKGEEISEKLSFLHNSIGAVLGPQDSWLLIRGMKTLALRMEKHQRNANKIVSFLKKHPCVEEVFYPEGIKGQTKGNGGMISFRLKKKEWIPTVLKNLRVISFAESLGGVESLMTYPSVQTHADIPEEIRRKVGVCDRLLRLSTGIEHEEDLIGDISQALDYAVNEENIHRNGGELDEIFHANHSQSL
ncbi:aminotransferase class I/II-fold pyridoxal phosphate-dependent enzyme [Microaerobacter geothermalis]|uniref:aminotransferase class I/II-fold pyridoxal phosphate-dependent enzyme n=1 Tax=Microaerobacter geothermalis TaxID=674972 RepID=UPI002E346380|nr:aminotransferase class I/II-fold pyridoxal phosphate-dependent enzyme [Microaerobacter geothermalis]